MNHPVIAIHGGAGTIQKSKMLPEKEARYKEGLQNALITGWKYLGRGRSAIDAVEAAVRVLEDNPLFNAGRGAVFTRDKKHEMDASIMCGKTLKAGSVATVCHIKNPITLARKVMEDSRHVFLGGAGAEKFAREKKLAVEQDDYFFDLHRYQQLLEAQKADRIQLDHFEEENLGTVGAVALDQAGDLAAATSTGGMTNQIAGRIGDSGVIGAGTYANNRTCAVSCTGHGENFIRGVAAYDVSCLMEYKQFNLQQACEKVVYERLPKLNGRGGMIAVDQQGNVCLPFNSEGMYRAWIDKSGKDFVGIY